MEVGSRENPRMQGSGRAVQRECKPGRAGAERLWSGAQGAGRGRGQGAGCDRAGVVRAEQR